MGYFVFAAILGALLSKIQDPTFSFSASLYCATGGPTRNELLTLFDKIELQEGIDRTMQKALMLGNGFLKPVPKEGVLIICTPMQWNAKNGYLFVEHENGKVVACRLRTEDNNLLHLDAWPPDKESRENKIN